MISRERTAHRVGFTLTELIIALMLLSTITVVLLPLMVTVGAQRRAAETRQCALIVAENLLDDLVARPWEEVTQEKITALIAATPSADARLSVTLPGLERNVMITEFADQGMKQVAVQLRWRNRQGDFTAPLNLSAWKFAPVEAAP